MVVVPPAAVAVEEAWKVVVNMVAAAAPWGPVKADVREAADEVVEAEGTKAVVVLGEA